MNRCSSRWSEKKLLEDDSSSLEGSISFMNTWFNSLSTQPSSPSCRSGSDGSYPLTASNHSSEHTSRSISASHQSNFQNDELFKHPERKYSHASRMVFFNRDKVEKCSLLLLYVCMVSLSFRVSPYHSLLANDVFDEHIPIGSLRSRITLNRTRCTLIQNVSDDWSTFSMCQYHVSTIRLPYHPERSLVSNSLSKRRLLSSGQFRAISVVLPTVCLRSEPK